MDKMIVLDVKKDNIFDVVDKLLANAVNSRYNHICFGLSDIRKEMRAYSYLNKFYGTLLDLGYNPISLFIVEDERHGARMQILDKDVDTSILKKEIPEDFSMSFEISEKEWEQAKRYAKRKLEKFTRRHIIQVTSSTLLKKRKYAQFPLDVAWEAVIDDGWQFNSVLDKFYRFENSYGTL